MAPRHCEQILFNRKKSQFNSRENDTLKYGDIISDVHNKKWRLGKSIGLGAFVSDDVSKPVTPDSNYVLKMEPHKSGPLFVEMNFYLRAAKKDEINEWKKSHKLKDFGMPQIYTFGSHMYKGTKMRFIIIPKYGTSLHRMLENHNFEFHTKTALTLAIHTINVLEYIHDKGYIHSDIKAMNMVLGCSKSQAPVYLIDFGLVLKYKYKNGEHKEESPDGRKAEAGTLEFSSRDSHLGIITRRSDLESLGFNIISWLGGTFPWSNCLDHPETVLKLKDTAMNNIDDFIPSSFDKTQIWVLTKYLNYVAQLGFNEDPDYEFLRKLFSDGIRYSGFENDLKITFDSHAKLRRGVKRTAERENMLPFKKKKFSVNLTGRHPCSTLNNSMPIRVTRNLDKGRELRSQGFNWAMVLAGHPEKDVKRAELKARVPKIGKASKPQSNSKKLTRSEKPKVNFVNPTPAMRKVIERRKVKKLETGKRSRSNSCSEPTGSGLTPAMEEIRAKVLKRTEMVKHFEKGKLKPNETGSRSMRNSEIETMDLTEEVKKKRIRKKNLRSTYKTTVVLRSRKK